MNTLTSTRRPRLRRTGLDRARHDADLRLQTYVERIWLPQGRTDLVRVTFDRPPDGYELAEQYAVLAYAGRPLYLVPLDSRAASVAGFQAYKAARSTASRFARQAVAAGFASGVAPKLLRDRLVISVHRSVTRERWGEVLLIKHLSDVLDRPDLVAFVAVRRINPTAKPTLQLFDRAGAPVGYAKIGASAPTQDLVRTEAAALAALGGGPPGVLVPQMLATGEWGSTAFVVGSPVPSRIRRWTAGPEATVPALRRLNALSAHRSRLRDSSYATRIGVELASAAASVDEARLLTTWLNELMVSDQEIEFGRMHGDWNPGNVGKLSGGLAAWDWEHSVDDAPVGLDLLHWPFHDALARHDLSTAVRAAERAAPGLQLLGVPASARRLVVSCYLLDMFVRWTKLVADRVSWNPKWHPDLIGVVQHRRKLS